MQAQKWVERTRENRNLRLHTFKRLMATRGAILSPAHVEALNMIDLEFAGKGKKDVEVRQRWEDYLDNLNHPTQDPGNHRAELDAWSKRNNDLLVNLLGSMSRAVGFNFTDVQIRRGIYTPLGHANLETEQQLIRQGVVQLLYGHRSLPVAMGPAVGPLPPANPSGGPTEQTPPVGEITP